jgi:cation diffusion facilitator CzcD-associated flavoprotein CzcO
MNQTEKPQQKKDVIIVGTGIAGSLIAKLLTDHVFDTDAKKMIHRSETDDSKTYKELSILMYEGA